MVVLRGNHLLKFNFMEDKSKGLGDSIEKFTKVTGIKNIVDQVNKLRGKRKDQLNKKFPYKK